MEVEARIIRRPVTSREAIGVQWGLNGRMMPEIGNTTNLAFPNQGTLGGRWHAAADRPVDGPRVDRSVNLPVPMRHSAIGIALGAVNGAFNLDVALSALERHRQGPRPLDAARDDAEQHRGGDHAGRPDSPRHPVDDQHAVTVTYKDAALTLRVTPQITAAEHGDHADHDRERERRTAVRRSTTFHRSTRSAPTRGSRSTMARRRSSAASSSHARSRHQDRTPVLHRVPLLGWLFKRDPRRTRAASS